MSTEPRVGVAVTFTEFDPKICRDRCGRCRRVIVTGQARCVCGAEFSGKLEA